MHWYRLLKQAEKPYGYWIGPDGSISAVAYYGHAETAAQILQYPEWDRPAEDDLIRELLERNYIRIVTNSEQMNVQSYSPLNSSLARKVKDLAQDTGFIQGSGLSRVFLDIPGASSYPMTVSELMQSLQGTRAKVAAGPYGYWLSPEGKLYPVNFEQHWDVAYNILGAKNDDEGLNMGIEDPVEKLFESGWTKLITKREFVIDWMVQPNSIQRKVLLELAEDNRFLEGSFARNIFINGEIPLNRREFNHYIVNAAPRLATSWYRLQKQAQIWQTNHDDENFLGMISSVYELEYKFNMMRQRQFNCGTAIGVAWV